MDDGNEMTCLKIFVDGGKNEKEATKNFSADAKLLPIMLVDAIQTNHLPFKESFPICNNQEPLVLQTFFVANGK